VSKTPQELTDVAIHPPSTRMRGVKALVVEWRPWIARFPECPALNQYQIIHVGIMEAMAPTRIVRTKQTAASLDDLLGCVFEQ
jgi:hypothetical protein